MMDLILNLKSALGIDGSLFWQLGCFIVSYLALNLLVFKPYMHAMHEREARTFGGEEHAVRIVEEAKNLHEDYEKKARLIGSQIKGLYDQERANALHEYDRVVQAARAEATQLLEISRAKLVQEVQAAKSNLAAEIPAVSSAIASRLAGKEL